MKIHIAGHGAMARAIASQCEREGITHQIWHETDKPPGNPEENVCIHVGSGRCLGQVINYCNEAGIPLIQASTGLSFTSLVPLKIPVVEAPNLAVAVITCIDALPRFAKKLIDQGMKVSLVESHQNTKNTKPGTALKIASALEIPLSEIVSVRDQETQSLLGIDTQHLSGHGYHWLTFTGEGVVIRLQIQVTGREAYAKGALLIAKKLLETRATLTNRVYSVTEFFPA